MSESLMRKLCQVSQVCISIIAVNTNRSLEDGEAGKISSTFSHWLISILYRLAFILWPVAIGYPSASYNLSSPFAPIYCLPPPSHHPRDRRLFLFVGIYKTFSSCSLYLQSPHTVCSTTVPLPFTAVLFPPTPATVKLGIGICSISKSLSFVIWDVVALSANQSLCKRETLISLAIWHQPNHTCSRLLQR